MVLYWVVRGAVASWLVRSSPGRGHCVVFLTRHLTLTLPLSTQVYKRVPANCWEKSDKLRGNDLRWTSIRPGGVAILLAASDYRNRGQAPELWFSRIQDFFYCFEYLLLNITWVFSRDVCAVMELMSRPNIRLVPHLYRRIEEQRLDWEPIRGVRWN